MKMKISGETIEALAEIITGGDPPKDGHKKEGYRSGPDLVNFFYSFGSLDEYGQPNSPSHKSRKNYTFDKIKEYNGSDIIYDIIKRALPDIYPGEKPPVAALKLKPLLKKDGYDLVSNSEMGLVQDSNGWIDEGKILTFDIRSSDNKTVDIQLIKNLDHKFINEQIDKARTKLTTGDFDGAITNCYSLLEGILKELLRKQKKVSFKDNQGDIRTLYGTLSRAMNLNPKGENVESYLNLILDGLLKQISGLYTLANQSSDRHVRKKQPLKHHAKLAVDSTFTVCEFLWGSYEYQSNRKPKKYRDIK